MLGELVITEREYARDLRLTWQVQHFSPNKLPNSRFPLTSQSNKRNLEGPIFGWFFVVLLLLTYAEILKTRTNMTQARLPFSWEETDDTDNTDDIVETVDADYTDDTDDTDYSDHTGDTDDTYDTR